MYRLLGVSFGEKVSGPENTLVDCADEGSAGTINVFVLRSIVCS